VNSKFRIEEDRQGDYDYSSEERCYGHALHFDVPENLYPIRSEERLNLQEQLKKDINGINNIRNEYISAVFIELEEREDRDWRLESGVLLPRQRTTTPETAERIWGNNTFRVFLSHKAEIKEEATLLKERLAPFGVSAFVAHSDIHPTKQWQEEIENALASMDAFVALLTKDFHESDWTDQEVGYALGRGVPLIAIKRGKDPYGFIAKFQALSCKWEDAPVKLAKLLIKQPRMLDCYIGMLPNCRSFDEGNLLSQLLPHIEDLTMGQIERLMAANNKHPQVRESYGFSGEKPSYYGRGLAFHLSRITGKKFTRDEAGKVEVENE
jgi:nucleoside 2-deoxyribosyltransferase